MGHRCGDSTPSISSVDDPIPSIVAPISTSIVQISMISGSRGVVDDGRALGQHRGHEQVLSGTHTQEVQPDGRSVQLTGLGDQEAVFAAHFGAEAGQAVDVHVQAARPDRIAPGSATSACPTRATSGPSTQIDARICRTRS